MRYFWKLKDHEHEMHDARIVNRFSIHDIKCGKCRRVIVFDGEWNVWITQGEYRQKLLRTEAWVESLRKLNN